MNRDIAVHQPPPFFFGHREGFGEKVRAIDPFPPGVVIGKVLADVAKPRRAKYGVGEGVEHDIGVGVSYQSARMRDRHASQNEKTPFAKSMPVVSNPHSQRHFLASSQHSIAKTAQKRLGHMILTVSKTLDYPPNARSLFPFSFPV